MTPSRRATSGASTTTHLSGGHPSAGQTTLAVRHGYTTAFWWAAGILLAGAVICGAVLRRGVLAGQGDSRQQDTPARQPQARCLATADRDQ